MFTTAAGAATPAAAVTNSGGEATATWELGREPGVQTVAARLTRENAEPQTEEFTAQAKPAALSAKSRTSQPGRRGRKVDAPPIVQVVDRFGNPVPEVQVAWQVTVAMEK